MENQAVPEKGGSTTETESRWPIPGGQWFFTLIQIRQEIFPQLCDCHEN